MQKSISNIKTHMLSEKELMNLFIANKQGMLVGYRMYNQLMLTTQVSQSIRIYSSAIDEDTLRIGNVYVYKHNLKYTPNVIKTIQMLEVLEHQHEIEDINQNRLKKLSEAFCVGDAKLIIRSILNELSYSEQVVNGLYQIVTNNSICRISTKRSI